jgi:hypothetical protein
MGNIDCHERRLKSLFGAIILLEYIHNLVEETVEIKKPSKSGHCP